MAPRKRGARGAAVPFAELVALDDLRPDPRNVRRHDAANLAAIGTSLREHGQVVPVVAWRAPDGALQLVGGHGTVEAARGLGWTELHVHILPAETTEVQARALAVRLNRTAELSTWDEAGLVDLLAELAAADVDVEGLGWAEDELAGLLGGASAPPPRQWEVSASVEVSGLLAPFPWFGGKSRAAGVIWHALGDVRNYVEPFAGSLGALLARPNPEGIETVNDADGYVVNFWRALQAVPDEVAHHAAWPVAELDLTARHLWLVQRRPELTSRLEADPEWYDARAAGWWVWGLCCWIGSGWCSGTGPWSVDEAGEVTRDAGRGVNKKLPHLNSAGRGVNKQLPHLGSAGMGVNKKLPHLGNAGRGVNKKLPHLGDAGMGAWFGELANRLRRVRVTCGDWSRVTSPAVCERHGLTGVLLDPPYPEGWDADGAYSAGTGEAASAAELCKAVFAAAVELHERGCRVVVCGYEGTWQPPAGWTVRRWHPRRGYAKGEVRERDVLWCSPNCVPDTGAADDTGRASESG